MSSRKFTARYPGTCLACREPIEVGDDLIFDDDQAVHFGCAGTGPEVKPREVCPRCFTEKAISGACACEDGSASTWLALLAVAFPLIVALALLAITPLTGEIGGP